MSVLAQSLAKRAEELFLNGKWIANTNYNMLLKQIDWEKAVSKKSNSNSIAALTFHINYYLDGVLAVLEGGELSIRDKYSFDMPSIESQESWENLIANLLENAKRFSEAVEKLTDEELAHTFVKEAYGNYHRNIEAIIEHGYYHLGQISLLNKMLE